MVGILQRTRRRGRGGISLDRFIANLRQLNHHELSQVDNIQRKPCSPLTIGLAVSGGVDSMALASLCSGIQGKDLFGTKISFRAFVVDHQVRIGSGDEARYVARVLEQNDIPTNVLKIQWPEGLDAKSAPNFESIARQYRFQALGRACRDNHIKSLFLAHHRDDQAETVLMRMINGHRKDGLCGMRLSGDIPECRGIYGVNKSGVFGHHMPPATKIEFDRETKLNRTHYLNSFEDTIPPHIRSQDMQIESGGIKIYRPLLAFSKAELKSTCEANGMSWFEDNTNADPTVTTRNAIRHIYANYKLPVALHKSSILALTKRLQEKRDKDIELRSQIRDHKIQVMKFDPRVPYCSAYFEPFNMDFDGKALIRAFSATFEDACWCLRAVIQMVSPVENIALKTLGTAVKRVFPELDSHSTCGKVTRKPFTVAGVMFEPMPSTLHGAASLPNRPGYKLTIGENSPSIPHPIADRSWLIRPQPFVSGKEPRLTFKPVQEKDRCAYWRDPDSWKLYDGRFWIRILNLTSGNISIRPIRQQDMSTLKGTKFISQLEQREKSLLPFKASKFRYVLPIIVSEVTGAEQIVAFPSLDLAAENFESLVKYQISYRSVICDQI